MHLSNPAGAFVKLLFEKKQAKKNIYFEITLVPGFPPWVLYICICYPEAPAAYVALMQRTARGEEIVLQPCQGRETQDRLAQSSSNTLERSAGKLCKTS